MKLLFLVPVVGNTKSQELSPWEALDLGGASYGKNKNKKQGVVQGWKQEGGQKGELSRNTEAGHQA